MGEGVNNGEAGATEPLPPRRNRGTLVPMVEIAEIKGRESLQAWLEESGQPVEFYSALANRAALRILPYLGDFVLHRGSSVLNGLSLLPIFRDIFLVFCENYEISEPLGKDLWAGNYSCGIEIEEVVNAAASNGVDTAYFAGISILYLFNNPTKAALDCVAAFADSCAADASYAASAARFARNRAWHEVQSDCSSAAEANSILSLQLWVNSSGSVVGRWGAVRSTLEKMDWQFWVDWYEHVLAGEPQPWPLLFEIARQDEEFWQGPDTEVMARINEIVTRFEGQNQASNPYDPLGLTDIEAAKANTSNAEEIFLNDGVFDVRPLTDIPPDPLVASTKAAMGLVSDMQEAARGSNAYGELAAVADDIETEIGRSATWPMMIYDALTEAVAGIDYLVGVGELPENDWGVERFKRRLSKAAHDIYLWDSYVRQAVDKRNEKHFDSLTEDDRRNILTLIRVLVVESSSLLAGQMKRDAETIAEAVNVAAASVKNAIYRVYSRIVAMAHLDWDRVQKLSALAGIGSFVVAVIALFVSAS